MEEFKGWKSREELLAEAKEYEVTARQLARWHYEGLLPRPKQRSLGRALGTTTIYPPSTIEQLLALCKIHESERRLSYIAWALWWQGFNVDLRLIRDFLQKLVSKFEDWVNTIVDKEKGGLNETTWNRSNRSGSLKFKSRRLLDARDRVGTKQFPQLMRVLADVVTGQFDGFYIDPKTKSTEPEQRIVEKGFFAEQLSSNDSKNNESDLSNKLRELSNIIRDVSKQITDSECTNEELTSIRDELRIVLNAWREMKQIVEKLPIPVSGQLVEAFTVVNESNALDQFMIFLLWKVVREKKPELIATQVAIAQQWSKLYEQLQKQIASFLQDHQNAEAKE